MASHDRPRDGRGHFLRGIDTVQRDAEACRLRSEGKTFQQIADTLGYADKGQAWRGVRAARADIVREPVEKLIATEAAELDSLYAMALEIIDHHHVTVSHGKVVTWTNPDTGVEEPLPDDGPKLAAIQTALRIRDQFQNLKGLKAEKKVSVSGGVRYEVVGVDPKDLT